MRDGEDERGAVAPAQLRLDEADLDTLWDYLLSESVSLGDHRQRPGWAQPTGAREAGRSRRHFGGHMQLPHQHRATLGRAITEGREGRGLDRDELAELSGVPALVIAGLEAGQLADVPAEYVGPLARSLGVWPSALLIAAGLHIQAPLPEGVEDVRQLNDLRRARHLEAAPDTYLRLRLADARDRLGEAGYARLCRSLYAAWEAAADAALTAAWLASGADAGPRG